VLARQKRSAWEPVIMRWLRRTAVAPAVRLQLRITKSDHRNGLPTAAMAWKGAPVDLEPEQPCANELALSAAPASMCRCKMDGHLPVSQKNAFLRIHRHTALSQQPGARRRGGPSGGGADPPPQQSRSGQTRSACLPRAMWMPSRGRLVSFDRRLGYEGRWRPRGPGGLLGLETVATWDRLTTNSCSGTRPPALNEFSWASGGP